MAAPDRLIAGPFRTRDEPNEPQEQTEASNEGCRKNFCTVEERRGREKAHMSHRLQSTPSNINRSTAIVAPVVASTTDAAHKTALAFTG
jgi:hypothetical protein